MLSNVELVGSTKSFTFKDPGWVIYGSFIIAPYLGSLDIKTVGGIH